MKNDTSSKELIYLTALSIVGRMLRKNPMSDISQYDKELLSILIGGDKRDPKGREYVMYFINKAIETIAKVKENE